MLNLKRIKIKFYQWLVLSLTIVFIFSCTSDQIQSFEEAQKVLETQIIPKIEFNDAEIPDAIAGTYSLKKISEPLPSLDKFPIYALPDNLDSNIIYIEIFSSVEKANAEKENEHWLVDVAENFNQKKIKINSGKTIQVGIRNIPSGLGARLIAESENKPNGYTPSNQLWLSILKRRNIELDLIGSLVPNYVGFVIQKQVYQDLFSSNDVTFEGVLDQILSNKLQIAYPNPYTSSSALNLIYTIFWQAANYEQKQKSLTVEILKSPQIRSVFDVFQENVWLTTATTIDTKELFLRDQSNIQAFPLEYQTYYNLKQLPGFEDTIFIPFGIFHDNPLVGFSWNNQEETEALHIFAKFCQSQEMQELANFQGFPIKEKFESKSIPPIPSGEVIQEIQSLWKVRKDGGKTVYMMLVIDSSGSMEGDKLEALQTGLKLAIQKINGGNYVGLISFNDHPNYLVKLATFDEMQHKRLLAAIDSLFADGKTAMYDALMLGLADLMKLKQEDPSGRFYLLLLSDGEANRGFKFEDVSSIIEYSGVRIYPIAYGEKNQKELQAIAELRESTVKLGNIDNIQELLQDLFETNL